MSECRNLLRDEDGQLLDLISLEPIPPGREITFRINNFDYCYDAFSLLEYIYNQGSKRLSFPDTRLPITDEQESQLYHHLLEYYGSKYEVEERVLDDYVTRAIFFDRFEVDTYIAWQRRVAPYRELSVYQLPNAAEQEVQFLLEWANDGRELYEE